MLVPPPFYKLSMNIVNAVSIPWIYPYYQTYRQSICSRALCNCSPTISQYISPEVGEWIGHSCPNLLDSLTLGTAHCSPLLLTERTPASAFCDGSGGDGAFELI